MTRVVIVQDYVPAYRAPFFEKLVERAAPHGLDVVVAAGKPNRSQGAREDASTVARVREVPQKEFQILGRRITTRRTGKVIADADLVILEQARRNVDAYRMLAGRRRQRPTALWGHGRDYTHSPGVVSRAAYAWLSRRADWFFAYTDGGRDAVSALGYPADRVTVVQNSVDTAELSRGIRELGVDSVRRFSRAHDLRGKTALFIGGLDGSKRIPFLLDAGKRVAERDPDFRLLVAGTGTERSSVVDAQSESPWLRYLGAVSGEVKAVALASSQVIAMPGRVGLVAVDSFAAGTPVVTTRWPWHAPEFEYLCDGVDAVVSNDDVAVYADALHAVLNDQERLAHLGSAAILAGEKYTLDHMAQRYLDGILRWRESPWLS